MFSSLVEQSFFISLMWHTDTRQIEEIRSGNLWPFLLLFFFPDITSSFLVPERVSELESTFSLSHLSPPLSPPPLPARDVLNVLLFLGHKQWPGSHGDFSCWSNLKPGSWECLSNYTTILYNYSSISNKWRSLNGICFGSFGTMEGIDSSYNTARSTAKIIGIQSKKRP